MMDQYSEKAWLQRAKEPIICVKKDVINAVPFRGDHTNDVVSIFMLQFILLSFTSHMLYIILRPLKQPRFVCNALGGILMSPHMPGRTKLYMDKVFPQQEMVLTKTVAYLGMVLYLFIVAVRMDKDTIRRTAKKASIIGISGFLSAYAIVLWTCIKVPLTNKQGLLFKCLLSAVLTFTRFPHVVYLLHELNMTTSELAQLAMSSSWFCEMVTWGWLFLPLTYEHSERAKTVWMSVASLLLFLNFAVRPLIRMIIKKTPLGKEVDEKFIVLVLTGALVLAVISDMVGALLLGVFVMGLMIPNGPTLGATLSEKTEHIATDLFLPMFYVFVGYSTDVSSLHWKGSRDIILLVFVGVLAKFVGAFLSAMICQEKLSHAVLLGLILNVRGPFDFWIYVVWVKVKELGKDAYTALILSQIITMAIATPLIEVLYDFTVRLTSSKKTGMNSIQASLGDAELRILCCIQNEDNVMGIISLIEASSPSTSSPIRAYIVHQNELAGRATPFMTAYSEKLKRTTSKNSHRIMQAFINYSKNSYGFVRVQTYTMSAPYKSMHEYICKLAQDEIVSLIIVQFHGNQEVNVSQAASLQNLHENIRIHAPCTVGILVDKGLSNCMNRSSFSCGIAVVFIGGADDREALALATRMSGHTHVSVFLLQIIVATNNKVEKEDSIIDVIEKEHDSAMIKKFKLRAARNNGMVTHQEVVVKNIEDAIKEIQMLEDKYNLIIVGHQQKTTKLGLDGAMLHWTEHVELGVIGDIISSYDFGRGSTSVLVMKHLGDDKKRPLFSNSDSNCEDILKIYHEDYITL